MWRRREGGVDQGEVDWSEWSFAAGVCFSVMESEAVVLVLVFGIEVARRTWI